MTSNDEYENFVNAHMEAAAECLTTKLLATHIVPWETLAVKKKRENVKTVFDAIKESQLKSTRRNLKCKGN